MSHSSHNHPVTATRGGAGTVSTPANSGVTSLFGGQPGGSVGDSKPSTARENSPTNSGSSGLFSNLHDVKRDGVGAGRKSSFAEQNQKGGFLSSAWNNFVHGSK